MTDTNDPWVRDEGTNPDNCYLCELSDRETSVVVRKHSDGTTVDYPAAARELKRRFGFEGSDGDLLEHIIRHEGRAVSGGGE